MIGRHEADAADAFALTELMFPSVAMGISVAARHGVADALADGPCSVAELAEKTGTDAVQLSKVLRLLAGVEVFRETAPDVFENTALSRLLRPGVSRSQHAMARLVGSSWLWAAWGSLGDGVATGRPGFELAHGTSLWQYLGRHPEAGAVFNDAMDDFSEALSDQVAAAYPDFAAAAVVADLGGGTGTYLSEILRAYPNVQRGILVDLEPVTEQARRRPALADLLAGGRLKLHGGDFFTEVPGGVDVYVVKQVMHSWDDANVVRLLQRCREASPSASFVAAEFVRDEASGQFVKNFDLVMTVTMNGNIRTEAEYAAVFQKAGYALTGVFPTGSAYSILEARPMV